MVGILHDNGDGVPEDPVEATRWFATGAIAATARSCYRLGTLTRDGRGVAPDPYRALALFETSCAKKYDEGAKPRRRCADGGARLRRRTAQHPAQALERPREVRLQRQDRAERVVLPARHPSSEPSSG